LGKSPPVTATEAVVNLHIKLLPGKPRRVTLSQIDRFPQVLILIL
jgi:hypothetical protein